MQSQTEKAGIMLQSSAGAVDTTTASPALLKQPHPLGQEPNKGFQVRVWSVATLVLRLAVLRV